MNLEPWKANNFKGIVRHFGKEAYLLAGRVISLDQKKDTSETGNRWKLPARLCLKVTNHLPASLSSHVFYLFHLYKNQSVKTIIWTLTFSLKQYILPKKSSCQAKRETPGSYCSRPRNSPPSWRITSLPWHKTPNKLINLSLLAFILQGG